MRGSHARCCLHAAQLQAANATLRSEVEEAERASLGMSATESSCALEAEAVGAFLDSVLAGKEAPFVRSQPEPAQSGPVVELVGSTYAAAIADPDKDVQGWGENDRGAPPPAPARAAARVRADSAAGRSDALARASRLLPPPGVSSHVSP